MIFLVTIDTVVLLLEAPYRFSDDNKIQKKRI